MGLLLSAGGAGGNWSVSAGGGWHVGRDRSRAGHNWVVGVGESRNGDHGDDGRLHFDGWWGKGDLVKDDRGLRAIKSVKSVTES